MAVARAAATRREEEDAEQGGHLDVGKVARTTRRWRWLEGAIGNATERVQTKTSGVVSESHSFIKAVISESHLTLLRTFIKHAPSSLQRRLCWFCSLW